MIPIAGSVITINPVQTPLVNTALPGASIVHVPYDNVAPSVSNAQVDNNARGNSGGANTESEQTAILTGSGATFSPIATGDRSNLAPAGQATFIAQLLSQGVPISGLLLEYEKLVSFSNVKYKPSNALKPAPAPAGVFGRILHQDKLAPASLLSDVAVTKQVQTQEVATETDTVDTPILAPIVRAQTDVPAEPVLPQKKATIEVNVGTPFKLPTSITSVIAQASKAYAASTQRNASIEAEAVADLA